MGHFDGNVVMVTGGTGNLGKPTAEAFAAAGANVVVLDRNAERQQELYADWSGDDRHMLLSPLDLMNLAAVEEAVARVWDRFGRIDVLVNTVGGFRAEGPLVETSIRTWDLMMDVNARTTFVTCHAVVAKMLGQGRGKVVNVSAGAGTQGRANLSAYSAAKSAVIRLTETLAAEVRHKGINANCILPGTIDTEDNREAMPKADHSKWVKPASLAEVILFLASDAARDIHGAAIPVQGLS